MRTKLIITLILFTAGLFVNTGFVAGGSTGLSDTPDQAFLLKQCDRDFGELMKQSELAFHGIVENIQFKMSEPTGPEQARVPYTFVTYRVSEVFQGQIAGDSVTLRFLGGLDEERMLFMGTSNTPRFDLGDEDILFVRGNNHLFCPLVENQQGRFRIVEDMVFTETGRAVLPDKGNKFSVGARWYLDDFSTTFVFGSKGEMVLTAKFGPDSKQEPGWAMGVDLMIGLLRDIGLEGKIGADFVNADVDEEVFGPDMRPCAPPEVQADHGLPPDPERQAVEADSDEIEPLVRD